ncbi:MAG: hypothetical protein IJ218_05650 [Alphaproteobacteria bacterium]|nr:hypothetical protein [Alphaproteobacteria bacterium]
MEKKMRRFMICVTMVLAIILSASNGYTTEPESTADNEILNIEETQPDESAAEEKTSATTPETQTEHPITNTQENAADTEASEAENPEEEELILDVFPPEFMASLRICRPDSETNGRRVFTIKGMRNDKCYLTYGNYILNVPTNVLNNIHSFDDLHRILKNKDMARYKYLPEYTYEGLIYALDACAHKEKYFGVEIEQRRVDAVITRGLSAEYRGEFCEIYLQNELELEDDLRDYGVTCSLKQEVIDELEPYFADIIEQYPDIETTKLHTVKEIKDADIALMYYLQQNNYCTKNNELNN